MSAPSVPKGSEIGNAFASQYYRHLVASPDTAHNFYHAEAGIFRLRNTSTEPIVGHEKIKAYIASSNYQSCKFLIDTIDSQEKGKGEILVLVSGIEIDEDKAVRPFAQTFLLEATLSGTRYLVRNDILRYLRNEILNIGEPQKTEAAQAEVESPSEERAELKEEQPLPVHVETTQVQATTPAVVKEEPQQQQQQQQPPQQPEEQPVPPSTKQHKPARTESKREPVDPSKPRAWASVVKVTSNGTLPAALATESVIVNPEIEEERENTPLAAVVAADKPKASRPEIMNSLYVSSLGAGCDTEEIKALFSRFGTVKNVQYTLSQGYCFVDFDSAESADKALKGGPLKLGDSELKLERRKALSNTRGGRGGRGGSRGGAPRGRGGPPREAREPRTTDRTERREPRGEGRPREGNDRRPPNKEGGARRGRGAARAAPAAASS